MNASLASSPRSNLAHALVSEFVEFSVRMKLVGSPISCSYRAKPSSGLSKTTPPRSNRTARTKDPAYMGLGYWALEATALAVAGMLLARIRPLASWFLAVGVAAGPLVGFILTRTVGLPNAMDDRGNWSETLGVVSLVVEGALLA